MLYEIKHHLTGAILFATEADSLKKAVEAAVAAGASLDGASPMLTPAQCRAHLQAAVLAASAAMDAQRLRYVRYRLAQADYCAARDALAAYDEREGPEGVARARHDAALAAEADYYPAY